MNFVVCKKNILSNQDAQGSQDGIETMKNEPICIKIYHMTLPLGIGEKRVHRSNFDYLQYFGNLSKEIADNGN